MAPNATVWGLMVVFWWSPGLLKVSCWPAGRRLFFAVVVVLLAELVVCGLLLMMPWCSLDWSPGGLGSLLAVLWFSWCRGDLLRPGSASSRLRDPACNRCGHSTTVRGMLPKKLHLAAFEYSWSTNVHAGETQMATKHGEPPARRS